jgi:hypothetical protein
MTVSAQAFLAAVFIILFIGSSSGQSVLLANPQPTPESIAPNIQLPSAVLGRLKDIPPSKVSISALRALKVELSAGSDARPALFYFEPLDNGLWAVALIVPFPNRANVMRSITLKGLIRLALTLDLIGEFDIPLVIPGKGFVPFSGLPLFKSTVKTSLVRKTTALSGDLSSLISPTPGARFSYVNAFETQTTGRGVFTTSTGSKVEVNASCVAAAELKSGTTLHPKLRGSFLPISCEQRRGQLIETSEYAFLIDSALYILLAITGVQDKKTTYRITDVEYDDLPETKSQ